MSTYSTEHQPVPGVVAAWTLSPDAISNRYEHRAPDLAARLEAVAAAARAGWQVRLCFDPLLAQSGWQAAYGDMIRQIASAVPAAAVRDISAGAFRMSSGHFRAARRRRPASTLLNYPFAGEGQHGLVTYPPAQLQELEQFIQREVGDVLGKTCVFAGAPDQ